MKIKAFVLAVCFIFTVSASAIADVPDEITYQGRLLYNGNPVTTATSVVFRLYQASTGGSAVWTETHGSVTPDNNGIYTEVLGSTVAIPDDYDALWIELEVAGNMLTPRKKLTSAPFVLRAGELPSLYVSGNVGIGTDTPSASLDVGGGAISDTFIDGIDDLLIKDDLDVNGLVYMGSGILHMRRIAESTGGATTITKKARGSLGSETIVINGDVAAKTTFQAYDGDSYVTLASMRIEIDGEPGENDMPGRFVFKTKSDEGSTLDERMRIDNAGNVGIGTTSPNRELSVGYGDIQLHGDQGIYWWNSPNDDNSAMGRILFVNGSSGGQLKFFTNNNERFKIAENGFVSGTYGTYHSSSDMRLKKDITSIPEAIEKVMELRGVTFRWKDGSDNDSLQMGMIAQEVEEVAPEVVHTADDEMRTKAIEYEPLIGLLVEAIKEQQEQFETQQELHNEQIKEIRKEIYRLRSIK